MWQRARAVTARTSVAQTRGVKAHRASVNGDETARDASRRATRRQAVRIGPATEAGLAIFAQVTDRAFTQNDDEWRTPANTLTARPSRSHDQER